MNRRPLNLQSNALPLSYSRSKLPSLDYLMRPQLTLIPNIMSSKEELYTVLSEKIVKLHDEMLRFTNQAQKTQKTIATAWDVTCLYADMYGYRDTRKIIGLKMLATCLLNLKPLVLYNQLKLVLMWNCFA